MTQATRLGGTFTFPGTELTVNRMGYGAMQLAGPHVFGPPKDRSECIRILRRALEAGVNHIDTSDFYGPHVVNEIIKEALHPYPDGLVLVTKLGARRGEDGSWIMDYSAQSLIDGLHGNLRNLGLEAMDIVNLRGDGFTGPDPDFDPRPSMEVLVKLQRQGLVRYIGVSNLLPSQIAQAEQISPVVCVQNSYNLASRADDDLIDALAVRNIPYVPYFPLGGFSPLQSEHLNAVAAELHATPMQVALAWLLQRSPNLLLIPGTSKQAHLEENLAAAELRLSAEALSTLNAITAEAKAS